MSFLFVYNYAGILSPWVIMSTKVPLDETENHGICGYDSISNTIITVGDGCVRSGRQIIKSYAFEDNVWSVNDFNRISSW